MAEYLRPAVRAALWRWREVGGSVLLALFGLWWGAESFGFVGDVWTCARIAQVIEREFGVRYHPAHVSRLLHQESWTYQKPILRASTLTSEI